MDDAEIGIEERGPVGHHVVTVGHDAEGEVDVGPPVGAIDSAGAGQGGAADPDVATSPLDQGGEQPVAL
ncbi:hypothetical protein [Kutzneria kofuensis]|uniref:hypothetical protein n=1 Tax=Kutzneria kofuensis TaxID=103725 RepID=UPI0031E71EF3